jgi:hypothetical protein
MYRQGRQQNKTFAQSHSPTGKSPSAVEGKKIKVKAEMEFHFFSAFLSEQPTEVSYSDFFLKKK